MTCAICINKSTLLFNAELLFKHNVKYYCCDNCGLIQTENPYWLADAYKSAITATDIGLISRNITTSNIVYNLIIGCFNPLKRFLDYGGGYGILVRLLRDKGLNFYRQDIYCENMFAINHDIVDINEQLPRFELITSFEVFEHSYQPISLLKELQNYGDNILISTLIIPKIKLNSAEDWWYFSPHTGQHVMFYTEKALTILASKFEMNLYSNGQDFHLFTRKKFAFNPLISKNRIIDKIKYKIIQGLLHSQEPKNSLIENDLYIATIKARENNL